MRKLIRSVLRGLGLYSFTLDLENKLVIVNLSGRGDKDMIQAKN